MRVGSSLHVFFFFAGAFLVPLVVSSGIHFICFLSAFIVLSLSFHLLSDCFELALICVHFLGQEPE